jgi:hypothetical protein
MDDEALSDSAQKHYEHRALLLFDEPYNRYSLLNEQSSSKQSERELGECVQKSMKNWYPTEE